MRYMIIVKGDDRVEAGAMPEPESLAAMADYHEALQEAGILVDGSGLKPSSEGFRIRYEGDKRTVVDGPFTETRELVAGYTIIKVASRQEALDWARRFPNPRGEGKDCEIEVRRMFELEDFEPHESIERFRKMEVGTSEKSLESGTDGNARVSVPIPHLIVSDGEAAIAFYEKAFGARVHGRHKADDGKRLLHAHLEIGDGAVFLNDDFPEVCPGGAVAPTRLGGVGSVIHLEVADADTAWEQAVNAGAEVCMPLENQFWGMRYGQLKDPFGHLWSIGGPTT